MLKIYAVIEVVEGGGWGCWGCWGVRCGACACGGGLGGGFWGVNYKIIYGGTAIVGGVFGFFDDIG